MRTVDGRGICAWFDLFDWVLTPAEYAAFGVEVPAGTTVVDGFVVAPGREQIAWLRRRKEVWAWRKLRKARRWARVLARIPWVRMIAIGNDLGYRNGHEGSDIDLVIVTAPRRVWLVRLMVTGLLACFRQRPGERTRDALCPSFFLTTEAMNLEPLQLSKNSKLPASNSQLPPDPYLLFWLTQLTVLHDAGGVYDAFWRANEEWVRRWLSEAHPRGIHPRFVSQRPSPKSTIVEIGDGRAFGDAIERVAWRLQERRLPPRVRELALAHRGLGEGGSQDTRVVVHDRIIKLHVNDRRARYREQWRER